jgi:SprT protein
MPVEPICAARQATVVAVTRQYIRHAGQLFDLEVDPIPVTFELKGRAAGMYRVHRGERRIRYNPYIFAKYFEDNLANTVPHEVAHYITDLRYGLGNVRPAARSGMAIHYSCTGCRTGGHLSL